MAACEQVRRRIAAASPGPATCADSACLVAAARAGPASESQCRPQRPVAAVDRTGSTRGLRRDTRSGESAAVAMTIVVDTGADRIMRKNRLVSDRSGSACRGSIGPTGVQSAMFARTESPSLG
jgi:hypothetical protein